MAKLDIYKASAGSGKTTLLTNRYVKLLADSPRNDAYRNILAVTFTNMATEEMKSRIVKILYSLSQDSEDGAVISRQKAGEVLQKLLHDYSRFNISTIDKFFQKVLRAFVHELGINANYSVQLDKDDVLDEAVNDLLLQLDDKKYSEILKWALEEFPKLLEEGKNWKDLIKNLEGLGSEIFKEVYSLNKDTLGSESAIKECQSAAEAEIKRISEIIQTKAEETLTFLDNLPEDVVGAINYEKTIRNWIVKLSQFRKNYAGRNGDPKMPSYVVKGLNNGFFSKAKKGKKTDEELNSYQVAEQMEALVGLFNQNISAYYTATTALKFLPSLRVLNRLDQFIKDKMKEENSILISDSANAINVIVGDSDAPFIYEKVGTRIDHYFLDEFQDTSELQWKNFAPLIAESLSNGNNNLVVGDVKQSIYRFRNSDWRILGQSVEREFPSYVTVNNLDTNYRSGRQIIEFNNSFFPMAAQVLQRYFNSSLPENEGSAVSTQWKEQNATILTSAYADVCQKIPSGKEDSEARVEFIKILQGESVDEKWEILACRKTIERIKQLNAQGHRYSDMAVLFRYSRSCKEFALMLVEQGINVISEESLLVASSDRVKAIVSLLRYVNNPNDQINAHVVRLLCPDFDEKRSEVEAASILPFYQMTEEFMRLFASGYENETAYLQAFSDLVLDFIQNKGGGVGAFLEWWDVYSAKKTVSMPAAADAITVMTIHKAKGLAFDFVFMPICSWDLFKLSTDPMSQPIVWCKTSEPLDQIPYLPVRVTDILKQTKFAQDYYQEQLSNYLDNLNLLYVAFTRPRRLLCAGLFLKSDIQTEEDLSLAANAMEMKNISDLLKKYICSNYNLFATDSENSDILYTGTALTGSPCEEKGSEAEELELCTNFLDFSQFKMRSQKEYNRLAERGTRMHYVMSKIRHADELEPTVETMLMKGIISEIEKTDIIETLKPYINNKNVKSWFDDTYKIINERDIISPKGKSDSRPDRILSADDETIVIDYKFGEPEKAHKTQVLRYVDLLKTMGFPNVHGYIYYHKNLEIVPCE